jgi:protein tyrosine phosphatase (PTP) superfamily phosphohydrolase (DUF442 family)
MSLSRVLGASSVSSLFPSDPPSIAKVSDELSRGPMPDAATIRELAARGFKTVVSLRVHDTSDEGPTRRAGMEWIQIPVRDHFTPSFEQVDAFLAIVSDPEKQPVFVHCHHGIGRTGIMSALYRIAREGWPVDRALAEARTFGPLWPWQDLFIRRYAAERLGS